MDRKTLKIEEAAEILGISRGLAYEAARSGQIPALRIGNRLVVPRMALERMLREGRSHGMRESDVGAVLGEADKQPERAEATFSKGLDD